jgi:hypothetical protein
MKLPSCTERTRSFVGSNISVNVTVEIREASRIKRGTVYGPPPTRKPCVGGEMMTCADPTPVVVIGGVAAGGAAVDGEG